MLRENTTKAPTWFETPDGLCRAGGTSPKLGTRLKFPQQGASLTVRWCSAYLKIDVCAIAINNQSRFSGRRTLVISGERAEESANRASYAEFEPDRTHANTRHVDRWRPVLHWRTEQVWNLIRRYRVSPHPAYRLGFGRVSCQFCIFGSDHQWATLWLIDPERVERLIAYEEQFGLTIHRSMSIRERIQRGTPYPLLNLLDIAAALDDRFIEPAIVPKGKWRLPAGANGETCGSP
ncbi:phosphoadenosine phosphosulfate reductase domain-containing protein [Leptolyngbya boryana]|nr:MULTISPECIES: phosphoadenosine phosphosulfate reductase family protein [Leptolyngbya]